MIVAIHQPDYIPYLGYFYKIAHSDIFVFLDDAQFSNDNMHHWNKIKTPQGELRLKIPVDYSFGDSINQVKTKDVLLWKEKHLRTLEMNYARAKHFKEIFPEYSLLIKQDFQNLAQMNESIIRFFCSKFGFTTKMIRSSEMNISSFREQRVIDICSSLGATVYLSGNGARNYQDSDHFLKENIQLTYTSYSSIEYPQLWEPFIPNMSILDFVFNCGYDWGQVESLLGEKDGNR